jgi:hypothetical protein
MVPQNATGLAAAMGGTAPAVKRLDAFFHDDAGNWAVKGGNAQRYDPGNEPGLHAPWLYNAFGQPAKTQATTREIVDTVYGTGPSGLPGNDDLGTMSAWYVFAAIGVFPQVVGRAELLVGSPLFPNVRLVRDNGVVLTIDAPATTDANQYVQSASLDGATLNRSWLPESFIRTGGTLSLTMGAAASTWGTATANRPPDRTGAGPVTLVQLDKCLDVNNSSTANGTKVQIWGCNGTNAQQWTVPGDGTVRALGKCLDVTSSGTANGAKLQLYDCNGTGAQQWTYVPASQALRNPQSGRCVDDPSSSTTNGTQLQLWDCNASNAQRIAIPA